MFDLESSIQQWKEEFGAIESLRTSDVLELESHLRESVTKLSQGELNEHEAFFVATQRLGQPAELNKEFTKVHGATVWRKRILWMLCGFFVYNLGSAWFGALATLTSAGIGLTGMGAATMGATSVTIWAIGWAALLSFALRKSKSPIAASDCIPLSWICVSGFFLVLEYVLNQAGTFMQVQTIMQVQTLGTSEYNDMFFWQGLGFLIVNVCVFVTTVALIWTLNERKSDAMETVT